MQSGWGRQKPRGTCFNTASGMDRMQWSDPSQRTCQHIVSIPQAVWIACNAGQVIAAQGLAWFQYRKRYGLHAMERCRQEAQVRPKFQYRKRYGLHAITIRVLRKHRQNKFQYRKRYGLHAMFNSKPIVDASNVSIPQAVWIACNYNGWFCLRQR
mgnify:CR=1 FL=1